MVILRNDLDPREHGLMNSRTFVFSSIALMTLGRAADTAITYRYSPGLELEANPLAYVRGWGWLPLLAVNVVVLIAIAACSILWSQRPARYEHSPEVRDLWSFASYACYGRVYPPLTFLWHRLLRPPTQRGHTLHLIGAVMPAAVVVMSVVAVLSWEALYGQSWEGYSVFYRTFWPLFPYGVVVPTVWVAAVLFYQHEFRRYREHAMISDSVTA